jgi:hypothetical protein
MKDTDASGEADILEYTKIVNDRLNKQQEQLLKTRKQMMDERYNEADIQVRNREVDAKIYQADKQLEVAKENKPARPAAKKK